MKIAFTYRWLQPSEALKQHALQKIAKLSDSLRIEFAQVSFERSGGGSPPFATRVYLAVPGPDIRVEERDHTIEASFHKVFQRLGRLARDRKQRRESRRRTELQGCRAWNPARG